MNYQQGFTLMETVLVLGIFGILLTLGMVATMDSFKRSTVFSEQSILVSVLEEARGLSMSNFQGAPYGVCYDNSNPYKPKYIIFKNSISDVVNNIEANPYLTRSFPTTFICSHGPGIIFNQISGETIAGDFFMSNGVKTSTTTINNEGTIIW